MQLKNFFTIFFDPTIRLQNYKNEFYQIEDIEKNKFLFKKDATKIPISKK